MAGDYLLSLPNLLDLAVKMKKVITKPARTFLFGIGGQKALARRPDVSNRDESHIAQLYTRLNGK